VRWSKFGRERRNGSVLSGSRGCRLRTASVRGRAYLPTSSTFQHPIQIRSELTRLGIRHPSASILSCGINNLQLNAGESRLIYDEDQESRLVIGTLSVRHAQDRRDRMGHRYAPDSLTSLEL
jgi:hypothetical protein